MASNRKEGAFTWARAKNHWSGPAPDCCQTVVLAPTVFAKTRRVPMLEKLASAWALLTNMWNQKPTWPTQPAWPHAEPS